MRRAVAAALILAILIVGTCIGQRYSKKAIDSMVETLEAVQTAYEEHGSLSEARKALDDFSDKWGKSLKFFSLVMRENHVDEVRFSLARVQEYLKINDKADFLSELAYLKEHIRSIYRCEQMLVDNIF